MLDAWYRIDELPGDVDSRLPAMLKVASKAGLPMHRKLGSNQLCAGYNKYPGTDSVQQTALLRLNHESPTGLGVDIRMPCPYQCGTVFAFSPHPTRGRNRGWVVSKAGFGGFEKT